MGTAKFRILIGPTTSQAFNIRRIVLIDLEKAGKGTYRRKFRRMFRERL
jgi:hypothetical protein